jgi:photosystem II stability/assembly factor-like uncharacterized protein
MKLLHLSAVLLSAATPLLTSAQSPWIPSGPNGGDARAITADPTDHRHLYLGSVTGTLFDSHDGGSTWKRVGHVGERQNLVLDNIVVDASRPGHMVIGAWSLDSIDGGLFTSDDSGKTWTSNKQLEGHSVRAVAQAPSDPKILVAGAIDGVYRSTDGGTTWDKISPKDKEFYEVESVAIDPRDAKIIYVGTWHLPWKTKDGGEHWDSIHKGVAQDSDVFSIIIDPKTPETVYASACSGIYKSNDGGAEFQKITGIPHTSSRTRVLQQDPKQLNTVFAGTTEGLYHTYDAGKTWSRSSSTEWIINDVFVDPQDDKHVLMATDRTGVMISNDGGATFASSNDGFSAREISTVVQDRTNPSHLYVGVINDREAGGVFASVDGGLNWVQKSDGLGGADVFSLGQAPDGTLLTGTRRGIFRLAGDTWQNSGLVLAPPAEEKPATTTAKATTTVKGRPAPRTASKSASRTAPVRSIPPQEAKTGAYAMATGDNSVFAVTEEGLLSSSDNGKTWQHVAGAGNKAWRMIAAQGTHVALADPHGITVSTNSGATFQSVTLPKDMYLTALTIDQTGRLWIGGAEGVFLSENAGASWHVMPNLYVPNVSGLEYDKASSRLLISSNSPDTPVFTVHTPDLKVDFVNAGWAMTTLRVVGDHMLGVTRNNGVLLQPKMVDSAMVNQASR